MFHPGFGSGDYQNGSVQDSLERIALLYGNSASLAKVAMQALTHCTYRKEFMCETMLLI